MIPKKYCPKQKKTRKSVCLCNLRAGALLLTDMPKASREAAARKKRYTKNQIKSFLAKVTEFAEIFVRMWQTYQILINLFNQNNQK